ncbi:hypothetical protein evm_005113 [Chilo suppressalis]|nr:hypothetical protein evm_005113 [Chilo suppressalis]
MILVLAVGLISPIKFNETDREHATLVNESSNANWTNCSNFVANTTLDPNSIIDIDWTIFYFWSLEHEDSYTMRFSVPDVLLLKRIRETIPYEPHPAVNWSNAELYMETSIDMSGVYIKTDTPGLYRLIPTLFTELQVTEKLIFGIKLVDGYLGLMNCRGQIAYALAPVSKVPKIDELHGAAARIGFWNPFGRSYLTQKKETYFKEEEPVPADLDDDDDEVQMEIAKDKAAFDIF